jgi:hypothetical protein
MAFKFSNPFRRRQKATNYKKTQEDCRRLSSRCFVHDPQKRATSGAKLKFSDRVMVVQPDGSLRTTFRLPNYNQLMKQRRKHPSAVDALVQKFNATK